MYIVIILGVVGLLHLFIAIIATKDLIEYPLFSTQKKYFWFSLIWLLPFIGSNLYHRSVGYDWNYNKSSSHSENGEGTDGGSGGDS